MTTDSASSRRATNASACADARSSHCASSITHSSGWRSAASESRLKVARPTNRRSGTVPALRPNVVVSASRCGPGSRSSQSVQRRAELVQRRERELHLRLHAGHAQHAEVAGRLDRVLEQRRLADSRFAPQDEGFAAPGTRGREQLVQRRALVAPTTQLQPDGSRTTGRHRPGILGHLVDESTLSTSPSRTIRARM